MPPVNTVQPRCPWPLAALAAWRPHRCPPQAAPAAAGSAWPWRTARLPGRARRGRWPGCRPGGQFARQGSHGVSNKRMKQHLHALGSSLARSRGDTCRSSPACTAGRPQPCHDTAGTGHAPEARDRKASAAPRGADGRLAKQGQAFAAGLAKHQCCTPSLPLFDVTLLKLPSLHARASCCTYALRRRCGRRYWRLLPAPGAAWPPALPCPQGQRPTACPEPPAPARQAAREQKGGA